LTASEYGRYAGELLPVVEESLARLRSAYDIVVIEGAGSPVEINIKENEIVNMRIAGLVKAPVLLVGDIDKGGVFASLVGTLTLLNNSIKGLIINKFRGDMALLQPGLDWLESYTSTPVIGVIPYYHHILIPEEDSISQEDRARPENAGEIITSTDFRHGQYDQLADIVRRSLNLKLVYQICGLSRSVVDK